MTAVDVLTDRQAEIYRFMLDFQQRNGYPPTYRTIGRKFGIRSTNGVHDHICALEKKGFVSGSDENGARHDRWVALDEWDLLQDQAREEVIEYLTESARMRFLREPRIVRAALAGLNRLR